MLARRQNCIQSIRLVTDTSCDIDAGTNCPLDLSAFGNVKSISWKGLRDKSDFLSLTGAIQRNRDHLVELELDLVNWFDAAHSLDLEEDSGDEDHHVTSPHHFVRGALGLEHEPADIKFPALQILSISEISLYCAGRELARGLDLGVLQTLKLRLCPGWENFLNYLTGSGGASRLKSLEIQSFGTAHDFDKDQEKEVSAFLDSFQGLKEFFICLFQPMGLSILHSALHHKSTLRNFVYHVRTRDDEDEEDSSLSCDSLNLFLTDTEVEEFEAMVDKLDLECIALACYPGLAVCRQLLHINQSKMDANVLIRCGR